MRERHEVHVRSMLGEGPLWPGLAPPTSTVGLGHTIVARTTQEEMIMRIIIGALLGLSLLAGASASASAADCKVTGWIDSGQGGRPIYSCPDQSN